MMRVAAIVLLGLSAWALPAAEVTWLTDLPKAQEQARREKKMVLLSFSGSDWCHWSKQLKAEVLETPEFTTFARQNLVLMEVDFPNRKKQSSALKMANEAIKKQYADGDGFPTLVVLKAEGRNGWKVVWKQVGCELPDQPSPVQTKLRPAVWVAKLEAAKKN